MLGKKKGRHFEQIFQDHITTSAQCAAELQTLFTNFDSAEQHIQKVIELEHRADKLVGETYQLLDNTFIARYDKPDIERLITELDHLIDYMKLATIHLKIYQIEQLRPEAIKFADIIVQMIKPLQDAIQSLPHLKMTTIQAHIVHVKELEEKADALLHQTLQNLFEEETDIKVVLKWRDIFRHLERVTDHAEHIANILSSIVRKESL